MFRGKHGDFLCVWRHTNIEASFLSGRYWEGISKPLDLSEVTVLLVVPKEMTKGNDKLMRNASKVWKIVIKKTAFYARFNPKVL